MKNIVISNMGYDLYELCADLGPGAMLETHHYKGSNFPKISFETEEDALKYVCGFLNTDYHKDDWCFEEDLDEDGRDGWVLHIIVDKNMKWANSKMISQFHKGKMELQDLLVNVFLDTLDKVRTI